MSVKGKSNHFVQECAERFKIAQVFLSKAIKQEWPQVPQN